MHIVSAPRVSAPPAADIDDIDDIDIDIDDDDDDDYED